MINFEKVPMGTLDVKTGQVSGVSSLRPEPTIGALPIPEFHKQVMALANSKTSIEKVHSAIDQHSDIENKPLAKSMASSVYDILGSGNK